MQGTLFMITSQSKLQCLMEQKGAFRHLSLPLRISLKTHVSEQIVLQMTADHLHLYKMSGCTDWLTIKYIFFEWKYMLTLIRSIHLLWSSRSFGIKTLNWKHNPYSSPPRSVTTVHHYWNTWTGQPSHTSLGLMSEERLEQEGLWKWKAERMERAGW